MLSRLLLCWAQVDVAKARRREALEALRASRRKLSDDFKQTHLPALGQLTGDEMSLLQRQQQLDALAAEERVQAVASGASAFLDQSSSASSTSSTAAAASASGSTRVEDIRSSAAAAVRAAVQRAREALEQQQKRQ